MFTPTRPRNLPGCFISVLRQDFYRAACNADAVLRGEFCPSFRPSVTCVMYCDKTEEKSVQIFIPYER